MKFGFTFTLAGLVFEIFGSLLLAVEAIGLDRVDYWRHSLGIWKEQTGIHDLRDPRRRDEINRVIIPVSCGLGSATGCAFALWLADLHLPGPQNVWFTLGLMVGALTGAFFGDALRLVLWLIISILRFAELRAQQKKAGVIGFLFLLVGFIGQFTGTLVDGLFGK